jgi:hypothetical protein
MTEIHESDQLVQRRANLQELEQLEVPLYPHAFRRTHTVDALVEGFGGMSPTTSSRPSGPRRSPQGA